MKLEISKPNVSLADVEFVIPDLDDIVPWITFNGRDLSADAQLSILTIRRNVMERLCSREMAQAKVMIFEAEAEGLLEQIGRQSEIDRQLSNLTEADKEVPEAKAPAPGGFQMVPRSVEQALNAEKLPEHKRKGLYGSLLQAQAQARHWNEKIVQYEYEITVFVSSLREGPAEVDEITAEDEG
jgi:hypothetical protein